MLDLTEPQRLALAGRVREAIAALPYNKAEVAERLGVSPQAITGWETKGRIGKTSLARLALLCGRSTDFFITGQDEDPGWSDVRGYASYADLGDGAAAEEYAEAHKLKFRTSSLRGQGLTGHRLEVYYGRGDSMEPNIRHDDAMLVDRDDVTPRDGSIFLLESEDGAVVKRLEEIDGRWYVTSDNKHDPKWRKPVPMDGRKHFKILGRVRWIGRWEG